MGRAIGPLTLTFMGATLGCMAPAGASLLPLQSTAGEPARAVAGATHPSALAAVRLRDMLQQAHDNRDGTRLLARKLSVEAALLPAFIVQDLAHGCASQDLARSMAHTYGPPDAAWQAGTAWSAVPFRHAPPIEPGWACPSGMAWRVRATTERLCCAGPEPAVAIDWVIESDGLLTTATAERFEPALMPAELDFPLLPWGLSLQWDRTSGQALDHSGRSHSETWPASAPILANPDDMFDTFDAIRVQQWLSRRASPASRTQRCPEPPAHADNLARRPCTLPINLDRGPLRWHDPTAYTLTQHGSLHERVESFRPVRLIPNIPRLRAIIEWRSWPTDDVDGAASCQANGPIERPCRAPSRIRIVSDGREQAIITFGRFELVQRGAPIERSTHEPPWIAVRQAIEARDAVTLIALVLGSQDGLGTMQARARMGLELAIQALDAAIEAGWTTDALRQVAPELVERCLDRLSPGELMWLTLDATVASRGTIAVLAATRLSRHDQAGTDERAWASMALPSLWAWLHEPPLDESPLGARRQMCDRALRPILLGDPDATIIGKGSSP